MKHLDVALSYYNIGVSLSKKTKGDSIIDLHPDNVFYNVHKKVYITAL